MRIAVIGDLMLDKYDFCRNRDNPESSAPCYTVERTEYKPGGAGNVAANLVKLGDSIVLAGILGKDENAKILINSLDKMGINHKTIEDSNRQTIVKERTMALGDGRYHYRKDRENISYIEDNHISEIIDAVKDCTLIIISDYKKGMISKKLIDGLRKDGRKILVDSKPEHKEFYKGVFLVKPNATEARKMAGMGDEIEAGKNIVDELDTNVLITRGENGMSYFGKNGERYDFKAAAKSHEVVDITGAGDTVIATFAHFLAKNFPIEECVRLANKAAGIAVRYPGCYAVSEEEVLS